MKKSLLTLLLALAPMFAWGQSLYAVKKMVVEKCSDQKFIRFHINILTNMLDFRQKTIELIEANPKLENYARAEWPKYIDEVKNKVYSSNKKFRDSWVNAFKDKPAGVEDEYWHIVSELSADMINDSRDEGLFEGYLELRSRTPTKETIERVFVTICENEVQRRTQEWASIEERSRQSSEARAAELNRQIQQLEDDAREARVRQGLELLNLSVGLMSNGRTNSANSDTCYHTNDAVSGLYRTCYYKCPTGVVTSTVGAAEICPLSRAAP